MTTPKRGSILPPAVYSAWTVAGAVMFLWVAWRTLTAGSLLAGLGALVLGLVIALAVWALGWAAIAVAAARVASRRARQ